MIEEMVSVFIMGSEYKVPKTLTIMKALEYCGYKLIRGCGCRGGVCGACGTVWRTSGDYKIKVGLACQTVVEEGMYLTQIPFFPAHKSIYNLDQLKPSYASILKSYPEIIRCLSCNTCTKTCPQDLKVMEYMQSALRGDIKKCAQLSFECIMCGLCASRCPTENVQYYIGVLARRLYGKYLSPSSEHLSKRVKEIEEKKFDEELNNLTQKSKKEIVKLYQDRDIEDEQTVLRD